MPIDTAATADAAPPETAHGAFARLGRNVSWLLGARGISGVLSLGYLPIAARALGERDFGTFALVLAYAGSIAGLAQFKSWQAVVRYGAVHLASGRRDQFADLIGFTAMLDTLSAAAGALAAFAGAGVAGRVFGWAPDQARLAGLFGAAILLTTGDTASGVLRLVDRFQRLWITATVAASIRLAGAALVWAAGSGLPAMLAVWAVAAAAESALEWHFALRQPEVRLAIGRRAWRRAWRANPRIGRFMADTSFAGTLAALYAQAGTLSAGAVGGASAAGAYRIASKLATALAQPAEAATRALFPELARLVASRDPAPLRRILARATAIGGAAGLLLVALAAAGGPILLRLFSGRSFAGAEPLLLLLAVASAVDLVGVVLEPLLIAHGQSRTVVHARVAGGVGYAGALAALIPLLGPVGAAVAAILGAAMLRGWLAVAATALPGGAQEDRAG